MEPTPRTDRRHLIDPRPWKPWLHADPFSIKRERPVDPEALVKKFRSVKDWADGRVGMGRRPALYHMAAYLAWREERRLAADPDRWVSECVNGTNRTLIEHLKELKEWAEGPHFDGDSFSTRRKAYTDVRSFYAHHLVPLPRSKLRPVRGVMKVETDTTAMQFLGMAKKVLDAKMAPRDRSILLTMLQGGMDASTLSRAFSYVAFPQLARHFGGEDWSKWDPGKVPVRVDLVRPKTDYRFYTFVDRDAVEALRDWLNARRSVFGPLKVRPSPNPKLLDTSDPIYVTDYGTPIEPAYVTQLFRTYGIRAGVNLVPREKMPKFKGAARRYPFHSHECRDTLVTLGRRAKVDMAVVNFFVGHSIDRFGYDKSPWDEPEHFREEYSKVGRYLNIVSGREEQIREQVEKGLIPRIQELEKANKELADGLKFALGALKKLKADEEKAVSGSSLSPR